MNWLYLYLNTLILRFDLLCGTNIKRTKHPDPGFENKRILQKRISWKTRPEELQTYPFFSSHMKGNVEVIYFHIKSRGVQGFVFVQITFENCTLNFSFWKQQSSIKKTIANLQLLLAWNVSACLRVCVCVCVCVCMCVCACLYILPPWRLFPSARCPRHTWGYGSTILCCEY